MIVLSKKEEEYKKRVEELEEINMRLYITNQKDLKALQDENTELQMQIEECQL